MTEPMTAKLDTIMRRVGKLLAVADDAATGPEMAATYRAKAEAMMAEYRLAEEDLIAQDQFSILPISKDFILIDRRSEFGQSYANMWFYIAEHCGLRTRTMWVYKGNGEYDLKAETVGYASDLRYAEFLWNAVRLVFGAKLEPSVDRSLSDQENVYNLRSAGLERFRIATLMWGEATHSANAKVTRLYAAACAVRGEDAAVAGRSVSAKDYREVYAREFTIRLYYRLREARDAAGEMGGGLVLHGRKERVAEAFYVRFPAYRPEPTSERSESTPCGDCAKTKHESGKCRAHRPRKMTKAERAKIDRLHYSETAQRARVAGEAAADAVQLERVARTGRMEPTGKASAIEA